MLHGRRKWFRFAKLYAFFSFFPKINSLSQVMADVTIEDAAKEEWDLVALPGGMPGKTRLCLSMI